MVESKYRDDSAGNGVYWDGPPEEEQAYLTDPARLRGKAKAARTTAVENIIVTTTTTGKTFDGDETAQTRMARAIIWMQATGAASIVWVLADNTETQATLAELTEALCLAGQAQADLWVIS